VSALCAAGLVLASSIPTSSSALAAPPQDVRPQTLRALYGLRPISDLRPRASALVLVDFQHEFFDGRLPLPNAAHAARAAEALLRWARAKGIPVVHINQVAAQPESPVFRAGSPGVRSIEALAPQPGEAVFSKSAGGAFTGTALEPWLRSRHIDTLIVAGLMTHLAVQLSATDAAMRGWHVVVAHDATASRDLPGVAGAGLVDHVSVERASLAALADRFADVLSVAQIVDLPLVQ
jgi:nicotinamidase-related amidase